MQLIDNFVLLFIESAPYLLLGMLIAGLIHQLLPKRWVETVLGSNNSVVTAAVIGAPLPLCSCSVIPVAMGIRRSGASKASTASFLVSTPETGVDSIGITYALMGPAMAIARPIAAIFSAIVTGVAVAIWGQEQTRDESTESVRSDTRCCHSQSDCESESKTSVWQHIRAIFAYGFDKLLVDFMAWLLVGLFFAALILTYVPADWMASYGTGPMAMIVMVVVSIPMYICATASTPIAVGLMMAGISPGAALVFMLTGPATNIATLMVIKNELGKRELGIYLVALIGSALVCGFALDTIFSDFGIGVDLANGEHAEMISVLHQFSGLVLAILILRLIIKRVQKFSHQRRTSNA